jgi:choline dehydrogenase-like flavoprotein
VVETYDYVIVGGGTAGAIVAARLSEDPEVTVAVVEWGPDDASDERALLLQRYPEMLGSEYDLDYPIVEQPRGNSELTLHRGRILGGTSAINNMGALPPHPADLEEWSKLGVEGWDLESFAPFRDRLAITTSRPSSEDRNSCIDAVLDSASTALGVPLIDAWPIQAIEGGAGYLDLGYDPASGLRSSSSVAYLRNAAGRDNLHLLLENRVLAIELEGGRAVGVRARRADGSELHVSARQEVVLSCGAIDTPRLLLLSGIGPAAEIESVGITPLVDLPGVGENLMDHVEGLVVFELNRSHDEGWPSVLDAAAFVAPVDYGAAAPQVMAHVFRYSPDDSYGSGTTYGYDPPEHSLSITPNVTRPKSRGSVKLRTADPDGAPLIDFSYFSDPEGHDERIALAGVRMARAIGATEPFADWVERELFPGPELQNDAELSARVRAAHGSVCHAAGTCRMGSPGDLLAVLDSRLRVRDVEGLRVVDASAFPTLTTFNPMVTVMMLAERAASMIKADQASIGQTAKEEASA